MIYHVKMTNNKSLLNTFAIEQYSWNCSYSPKVSGKMGYLPDRGFIICFACYESDPKRIYFKNNDPVYRDSCMEAFINFDPKKQNSGYINFEINANGAMICGYGSNGINRETIIEKDTLKPVVVIHEDFWGIELLIPLGFIRNVYGEISFHSGDVLAGNFYKCGDKTAAPHYGSWAPIVAQQPNFHLPQFFGKLVLCEA